MVSIKYSISLLQYTELYKKGDCFLLMGHCQNNSKAYKTSNVTPQVNEAIVSPK